MIGARLGKWIIDKELGRGGMGAVYLAHEEATGRPAAAKILAPELAQESGFLQRFQREIDVLAQLHHPNIVAFYDSGMDAGLYYYAMEFVAGDSYEHLLNERGRLPWQEVLDAALQICPALKHAHDRGIVHRDIKPPNLLKTAAGVVKLTDFGIAKVFASQQLTRTGGLVGTAEYLSPEQAAGKQASKRSDLYSLGVVLYTLLTGRPPFEGRTTADILHKHLYAQFDRPNKVVPELPYEIDEVVCQLLEKDPARRPADGLILHRQLDSIRRKLERKAQLTVVGSPEERTMADNQPAESPTDSPGPATLMSRLMRGELDRQNQGGTFRQWINRPWVLAPLFLICVGLLVFSFWFRPKSSLSQEDLFVQGSQLMQSQEPADWDRAWNDYLEPLNRNYPDHPYQLEVEGYRHQIEDYATLRRALNGVKGRGPISEAQRFYRKGVRYCLEGDADAARQVWQNLVDAFGGLESEEKHWVFMAQIGLAGLESKAPARKREEQSIARALERASKVDEAEAEKIRHGLEDLYRDDPSADKVRKRVQEARDKKQSNQ